MDEKHSYAVKSLFTGNSFNTRLIEVEIARQEKIKNQLIFGGLISTAWIVIGVLGFRILGSIFLFFVGSGIFHLFTSLVSGGIIYGLIRGINWAKNRINFFVKKHNNLLFFLRKDAIECFVKIIFPNAEQIIFEPQISSQNQMQPMLVNLFYNEFYKYTEKNTLSFTINKQPFQMADVEPVYALNSKKESIELDKFIDRYNRKIVCYFKSIVYQIEYEKENLNSDFLTVIIPKKAAPSPTKKIIDIEDRRAITVSKDYPRFELLSRDKRRPERFIQRGFEEYSVENMEMEDNFYVFTNNENASRKLLSYRFMEKIVKITSSKKEEISQPKVVQLLLSNQETTPTFWMQFTNITRQNNKPLQKLTVVTANKNLIFFDLTGEKSCNLDNFLLNFQKLENILNSIITELNVVPTTLN
ncbi:hypothetical protein PCC7424_5398 (plasmid) [Gloeothece citriformis PCC 7424]|uniref:Uncharacterized protein n=1 Tax=Gloeothece citriformis (strain PCC 7424) TaxID=65393 RepID=B7KMF4_GLOC7|nr:DUF3137 domain-containing protein [Gloeothece citriformis]ACK73976.1 hypothetical protein PCC7424_5398 [Gloeothece citriformis PCC 7424]